MHSLIRFMNHGTLPFAGRDPEREQILSFCRMTGNSGGLRSLAVVAAAGMGKTRLLDEVVEELADRFLALRIRLYADSSLALSSMIVEALERSGRTVEEGWGGGAVIRELREAARLRPVILVIEDLHLLSGEPVGDLVRLLEGVAEEPISLIVTARSGEHASLDALERWPREEIVLEGIDRTACDRIWEELFEESGDSEVIDVLLRHTLGTPLALRNALASALRSGAYAFSDARGGWRLSVPVERFEANLQGDISRLLRGITAFLTDEERRSAAILAGLGETFAVSVGRELLGNRRSHLDSLRHKCVLIPAPSVQPIFGDQRPADEYVGFAHTLLHHNLAGELLPGPPHIVSLLAGRVPLSSTLPFRRIIESDVDSRVAVDLVRPGVEEILRDALAIDRTADWGLAPTLLRSAERLFECYPGSWGDQREAGEYALISARLRIDRRRDHSPEYLDLIERMTRMVMVDDLPERLLIYRLVNAAYRYQALRRGRNEEGYGRIFDEVDHLVERYPELRGTTGYVDFLEIAGRSTTILEDNAMVPRVEKALEGILSDDRIDSDLRNEALRRVAPLILWVFNGREELDRRLSLLARLEKLLGDDLMLQTRKMALLDGLGRSIEAWGIASRLIPTLRSQGLRRDLIQTRLYRLYASLGFGKSYVGAREELRQIEEEAPAEIRAAMNRSIGVRFTELLLLRGEEVEGREVVDHYLGGELSHLAPEDRLVLAVGIEEVREIIRENRPLLERYFGTGICRGVVDGEVNLPEIRKGLSDLYASPILMRNSAVFYHFAFRLIEAIPEAAADPGVRKLVTSLIEALLDWQNERHLFSLMEPVLERYAEYLSKDRRRYWSAQIAEAARQWGVERNEEEGRGLALSMLGEIAVRRGDGDPVRVRGGRLRTLLGLLAAEPLLRAPLTVEEFRYVASGREDDPERARKTTAMGLLRLRELLGEEAVDQSGEIPRLDRRVAEFDVHEVIELLQSARANGRQGQLLRSVTEYHRALEILDGETPFPTLYDDFFEAVRGELELLLRSVLLEVVDRLREAGEGRAAEDLLCSACRVLPGDDEIREHYSRMLRAAGHLAEAERLRMIVNTT